MGDRAWVSLTIAEKHTKRAEAIMDEYDYVPSGCDRDDNNDGTITYSYDDVNYGDLDHRCAEGEGVLENLRIAGIPYDVEWEAGCEFPAGGDYFRVLPNGEPSLTEVGNRDQANMVSCDDIMKIINPALQDDAAPRSFYVDTIKDVQAVISRISSADVPPITLEDNAKYID